MTKVIIGIVIAIIILGGAYFYFGGKSASVPSSMPTKTTGQSTVTLTANGFSPATLIVPAGTKVTWTNNSGANATVNSNPHPVHTDYSPLNLGTFPNGGSLSLVFDKQGTYGYHNHLNPGQTGTIVVQ